MSPHLSLADLPSKTGSTNISVGGGKTPPKPDTDLPRRFGQSSSCKTDPWAWVVFFFLILVFNVGSVCLLVFCVLRITQYLPEEGATPWVCATPPSDRMPSRGPLLRQLHLPQESHRHSGVNAGAAELYGASGICDI